MRKITPLADCGECGASVPPLNSNVVSSVPMAAGVLITFRCPFCEVTGRLLLSVREATRRAHEIAYGAAEGAARERIGREVKGFAVDLAAVITLDDLLLFWSDQERFAPWTVVKENSRG